jgi:hypothetical protein
MVIFSIVTSASPEVQHSPRLRPYSESKASSTIQRRPTPPRSLQLIIAGPVIPGPQLLRFGVMQILVRS